MKTLKHKIFAGALTLATLGIFGGENVSAQDVKINEQENVEITWECFFVSKDKDGNKRIEIPCFNESPKTGCVYKTTLSCKKGHNHIFQHVEFSERGFHVSLSKLMPTVNYNGKCIRYPQKLVDEAFIINRNTGLIDYRILIADIDSVKVITNNEKTLYLKENLTKEDIYKKFGEDFVNRTKEIINANEQRDSLKLVNLIKKEYQGWRNIENENGGGELRVPNWYTNIR